MGKHQPWEASITPALLAPAGVRDTISMAFVREALCDCALAPEQIKRLLCLAGIDPAQLHCTAARVSSSAYGALWRLLAEQLDDELFGMDRRALRHGSLAFACRTGLAQPTLGQALEAVLEFLRLMLGDVSPRLRQADIELPGAPPRPFACFTLWLWLHGIACWLVARRLPVQAVELRAAPPDTCMADDYRAYFGESITYHRAHNRLRLAPADLALPIRRTPQALARFLAGAPGNLLVRYREPDSLAQQLRRRLRHLAPSLWPSGAQLAAELQLSTATLRRRLAQQGASYQALKDQRRQALVIQWLREGEASLEQIAERLGFADERSLFRAFRQWTGRAPGDYRRPSCRAVTD